MRYGLQLALGAAGRLRISSSTTLPANALHVCNGQFYLFYWARQHAKTSSFAHQIFKNNPFFGHGQSRQSVLDKKMPLSFATRSRVRPVIASPAISAMKKKVVGIRYAPLFSSKLLNPSVFITPKKP